jgi:hypothetical protein
MQGEISMKHLLSIALLFTVVFGRIDHAQAESVEFRNPTVENHYPDGITFRVEVCGREEYSSTDFDYTIDPFPKLDSEWIDAGLTFYEGQTSDGCFIQKLDLDTKPLDLPPFTVIHYYWSLGESEPGVPNSPIYAFSYRDSTLAWKSLVNRNLIVRWHDRPDSFGQEVMSIAEIAYQDQAELYNGSLEGPITIVITNTQEEFDAWRAEDDVAGGTAFPEVYLTTQVVEDEQGYENWLYDVIPHEISHIFFGNLLEKNHSLPLWLNEGFATYLEYSDHWDEWTAIRSSYGADSVWALSELEPYFRADEPDVYYAYAEGYYAVLYMYETYGDEAVSHLLSELQAGNATEIAFQHSFGVSLDQFESEYIVWLTTQIGTPPPSTALPMQTTDLDIAKQLGFSLIMIICVSPIFLVGFGVLGLGFLWVLNDIFSVKEKTTLP